MIHLLDEATIQKIAAGEVIERPVSVIKELVENSVDAGANEIQIEISDGGKTLISVRDNGSGMAEGEIEKAFLRHATSKITDFEDLYSLASFGFRGEALASIAAVSKLTCRSRTKDESIGKEIRLENGKVIFRSPIAMEVGTQILAEDLFYAMPVRRNTLKSVAAEGGKITQLLYRLAIGNPEVSFRYIKDGKRIFQTQSKNTLDENLMVLFGTGYFQAMVRLSGESPHFRLTGRMGNNTYYRGNRLMEFLYVNRRLIEDEEVQNTIENVFKSVIPNGRFPAWQIFIETDPSEIEVNIHPSKKRIFFQHKEELLDLIEKTVKGAIFKELSLPHQEKKSSKGLFSDLMSEETYQAILDQYAWPEGREGRTNDPSLQKKKTFSSQREDLSSVLEMTLEEEESEEDSAFLLQGDHPPYEKEGKEDRSGKSDQVIKGLHEQKEKYVQEKEQSFLRETEENALLPSYEDLRFIGIVFKTYIILEDPIQDRLLLIDQHAAHERINFERFMKQVNTQTVISQRRLQPLSIKLSDLQMDALKKKSALLKKLGYGFDIFAEDTVVLRELPSIFAGEREEGVFLDLLDLSFQGLDSFDAMISQMAMKACRASIKQGDVIGPDEVRALYLDLLKTAYPLTCPHGRPTVIIRRKRDFENVFMRIK